MELQAMGEFINGIKSRVIKPAETMEFETDDEMINIMAIYVQYEIECQRSKFCKAVAKDILKELKDAK